jgi:hypothetical protein
MTVGQEHSPAASWSQAIHWAVLAAGETAATRELVALTYDNIAREADTAAAKQPAAADAATRRAAWARSRAEQQRHMARQLWAIVDAKGGSVR